MAKMAEGSVSAHINFKRRFWDRIREHAHREGIQTAELVRKACDFYMRRHPPPADPKPPAEAQP